MPGPKLRFKNEDGKDFPQPIPRKFIEIVDKISDGIHSTPKYDVNGKYFFINGNNLINGQIEITPSTKKIAYDQYLLHKSDLNNQSILLSINGTIGNLAFYDNQEVVLGKSACYINLKSTANKKYIYQLLQTPIIKNYFEQELTGSTIKNLSLTTIKNTSAEFPVEQEQTKIANFLTAVDQKIAHLTKKHELLIQYKKGVMQKIFNQEIRFKDEVGKDFLEWKTLPLCEVAQIIGGGTPETSVQGNWGGDVQWFTPTELKQKYVSKSVRTITTAGLANSSAKLLPAGTVLFSSRATVGDAAISLNECCTNQGFQSFVMKSGYNNEFLYYWIANNKKLFLEKASGSTFLEISKREIEKLPIQTPSIDEQKRVADFLGSIDLAIELNQHKLDLTKQYKQGLLQQMFI